MKRPEKAVDVGPRPLTVGCGETLREGGDGTVIACGVSVAAALEAAERLSGDGVALGVVNMATIKPLDRDLVVACARRTGLIVAAENHTIIGGLGSAIAETLIEAGVSAAFARVGVADCFAEGGSTPYLQSKYGLDGDAIVAAFRRLAGRRA